MVSDQAAAAHWSGSAESFAWFKDTDFAEIACKWMGSGNDCKESGCEKSLAKGVDGVGEGGGWAGFKRASRPRLI